MGPELTKPDSTLTDDQSRQKNLDKEVRELISALTNRLTSIKKSGTSSHQQNQEEDEQGVRIITLTGSNLGATMRGEIDEKPVAPQGLTLPESEDFTTYVNSNFQAINNSIMLGGSYETNDPGVHLDISDYIEQHNAHPKRGKKGKKNERGNSKSDQHSQHSE